MPASMSMNAERYFENPPTGEFPAAPLPISTGKGSFDCVVVRDANDNSAQDDIIRVR
jgi:hypothetical protein